MIISKYNRGLSPRSNYNNRIDYNNYSSFENWCFSHNAFINCHLIVKNDYEKVIKSATKEIEDSLMDMFKSIKK